MAKQLLIRPMQTSDLDAVLALQGTIYPSHYHEPRTVFASKLALAAEFCFVVTRENTLMGYLFAHPWLQTAPPALFTAIGRVPDSADSLFIHDMALHPDCRSRSLGQQLLQSSLAAAAAAGLSCSTLVAVQDAARFWLRQGYQPCTPQSDANFPGLYGCDAQFMRRPVTTAAN
ncbi:MAG: hypothetical protein RL210_2332 [Pseudomonadota bacterium]|nr:family N-acetyltransferase [Pseudomonadota bacterium]